MYAHNTKICGEGNRFLLTGFPICGGWEHSCSEPLSSTGCKTSLVPKEIATQSHAPKFPVTVYLPFWDLSWPCKPVSILSRICTWGFQSYHYLITALSLSQGLGCAARSLQMVVQDKLHLRGTSQIIPPYAALRVREWKQSRTRVPRCTGL